MDTHARHKKNSLNGFNLDPNSNGELDISCDYLSERLIERHFTFMLSRFRREEIQGVEKAASIHPDAKIDMLARGVARAA